MKIIKIKDEIYYASIFVIPQSTNDQLIKYFKKKYNLTYERDNYMDAFYYMVSNDEAGIRDYYLIFNNFENSPRGITIFVHEIIHLAFAILKEIGMKFSGDSEEGFAYYTQNLTAKILEKLL